jgi:hypothetical protein
VTPRFAGGAQVIDELLIAQLVQALLRKLSEFGQ